MNKWETEPNHVEFEHLGMPCIIHRNDFGAWCGYVAVSKNHPAYKRDYDELQDIDVHGGLTYSEKCQGSICHKTDKDDDVWWLGFDCAHFDDLVPYTNLPSEIREKIFSPTLGIYRDQEYVTAETKRLAEQLAELSKTAKLQ